MIQWEIYSLTLVANYWFHGAIDTIFSSYFQNIICSILFTTVDIIYIWTINFHLCDMNYCKTELMVCGRHVSYLNVLSLDTAQIWMSSLSRYSLSHSALTGSWCLRCCAAVCSRCWTSRPAWTHTLLHKTAFCRSHPPLLQSHIITLTWQMLPNTESRNAVFFFWFWGDIWIRHVLDSFPQTGELRGGLVPMVTV